MATMDAATLFFSEPESILPSQLSFSRALVDVQLGDEVLVAGNHHHHQQATHQRHVDQRQHQEDQLGLGGFEDVRQDVKTS